MTAFSAIDEQQVAVNGIQLQVKTCGEGPLVVLCHGFPQTSNAWKHQIPALAAAGYRVLAPDMRGYGRSSRPPEIPSYDADSVSLDLIGLLDWAGQHDAVFVGHDIGAMIVWYLARAYSDRVRALAALTVPLAPRTLVPPTTMLATLLGSDHYLVFFQEPQVPDRVLSKDVRRTLLTEGNWTHSWSQASSCPPRPEWLTEEELADEIATFNRTGFSGGLAYYRNFDRNWQLSARFADELIGQPTLFITGSQDIVRTISPTKHMTERVPDLRMRILDGAGHFIQQERPAQVNHLLLDFLREVDAPH